MAKGSGVCNQRTPLLTQEVKKSFIKDVIDLGREKDYNSKVLNYDYIDKQEDVKKVVEFLKHKDINQIALDIETTGGLKPWMGSIRLVQIGVEKPYPKQFLLDTWHVNINEILPFFEDEKYQILTCNGRYEQLHLYYRYGIEITNMYDVKIASQLVTKDKQLDKKVKIKNDFKQLMRRYVGKQISKTQQVSSWDNPELGILQRNYAAMDVAGLLDIYYLLSQDAISRESQAKDPETKDYFDNAHIEAIYKSQKIYDSILHEYDVYARKNQAYCDKFIRAFKYAESLEELNEFKDMIGQYPVGFHQSQEIEKAYNQKLTQLKNNSLNSLLNNNELSLV